MPGLRNSPGRRTIWRMILQEVIGQDIQNALRESRYGNVVWNYSDVMWRRFQFQQRFKTLDEQSQHFWSYLKKDLYVTRLLSCFFKNESTS